VELLAAAVLLLDEAAVEVLDEAVALLLDEAVALLLDEAAVELLDEAAPPAPVSPECVPQLAMASAARAGRQERHTGRERSVWKSQCMTRRG
jgi:hypothetical protein